MKSFIIFTVVFMFAALVVAQEPSISPEIPDPVSPAPSPMTNRPSIPKLYLSSAGNAPHMETEIEPFNQLPVCPNDFITGFSIRCGVTNAQTVDFYVNGKFFRREFFTPYFLAGNFNGTVYPFRGLENTGRVRVACRVSTRRPVWVDVVNSC